MKYLRPLASYRPLAQPLMTRPTYARELVSFATMPAALALVEGGVVAVLAQKVFGASDFAFATIMAAPMFANLTSIMWARFARGRKKVPFMVGLQVLTLALVAGVAVLPRNDFGAWGLVLLLITARCAMAGLVTLRSTIWRHNYPRHVRATITGRLVMVMSIVIAVAPLLAYAVLDYDWRLFRVMYPAAAVIGAIGVWVFRKIRLRHERELLAFERQAAAKPMPHGTPAPIYEYDKKSSKTGGMQFWQVLKRDKLFRSYMTWQFVGGMANLMGEVAIAKIIIDWTAGHVYEFAISISLIVTLPLVVAMATMPMWARYLDRVHIVRFRVMHGLIWILLAASSWLCVSTGLLGLLVIPRIASGLMRGGGMLAWNLGHNDFADRRMVATYMGIHVTLTGVRGLFAAYIAVYLMQGWGALQIANVALPKFDGLGTYIFAVCLFMTLVSELGFIRLDRRVRRG